MEKQEQLFNLIQATIIKREVIYGETHILNISDEPDEDKFSVVHYRVYSKEGIFDILREYHSEAEDGAGGIEFEYIPDTWDGFDKIGVSIERAIEIVIECIGKNPVLRTY